ncbi:MAG: phosphorylase [Planktothrix sp.]|uniref:phosphorylase family protein n=1 Tax=Planktothrix sp. TaxID=3088171 RepID=UPI0038D4BC42
MQPFNVILVPQGQEYKAVVGGLKPIASSKIQVVPIPIGSEYLTLYLQQWLESEAVKSLSSIQVLVLGLCGGLSPHLNVGDVVVYQHCLEPISETFSQNPQENVWACDLDLTLSLHQNLIPSHLVRGLTSKQVITTAYQKQQLSQQYDVEAVDMEGRVLLELLTKVGIKVAMVRVVSDDCSQNLPDLTTVIDSQGNLQTFPFIKVMLQHPREAFTLVRNGLKSLQTLQQITQKLRRLKFV